MRFINRNHALEKSNYAHDRLTRVMYDRKDFVSSEYHFIVGVKQHQQKRILTKKERSYIYDKCMKKYGVYKRG